MIKNDTSFDLQYIDQDYMQAPQSNPAKIAGGGSQ